MKMLIRFGKIISVILLSIIVFLMIAAVGFFHFKKDEIARHILTSSNKYLAGNLDFDNISLSDVINPTRFVIDIQNLSYYLNDTSEFPALKAKHLFVGLNLKSLIKGEVDINAVEVSQAKMHITQFADSSYNISHIFKSDPSKADTIKGEVSFSLQNIQLKEINIKYQSEVYNQSADIQVFDLSSALLVRADSAAFRLSTRGQIKAFIHQENRVLKESHFVLDANVFRGFTDTVYTIKNVELTLGKALLMGSGEVPVAFPHLYRFSLSGKNDLSLIKLFLTPHARKNIQVGNVSLSANIQGLSHRQIPSVDLLANIEGMNIDLPKMDYKVSDLYFKTQLKTGVNPTFSDALLRVDTLSALFPKGYIQASGSVKNAVHPKVDMLANARLDLSELSQIFKVDELKEITGNLAVNVTYEGEKEDSGAWSSSPKNHTRIQLENAGFMLPEIGIASELNGTISGTMDSLVIDTLYFNAGRSDIAIRGEIENSTALFVESELETFAKLHIKSTNLDLPEFLQYYPEVKKGFDFRFKRVDIHTQIKIPNKTWRTFKKTPTILFELKQVACAIDSFLPPIQIANGLFTLTEDTSKTVLDFDHLDIQLGDARLEGDFHYFIPDSLPQNMEGSFNCTDLDPVKTFAYYFQPKSDSPDFKLSGNISSSLTLSNQENPNNFMNDISFAGSHLELKSDKDTFTCARLEMQAKEINLNDFMEQSFIEKMESNVQFSAQDLSFKNISIKNLRTTVAIKNGAFLVEEYHTKSKMYEGGGSIVLKPFQHPPSYSINLDVDRFRIEQFLEEIQQPAFVKGEGQFLLSVNTSGENTQQLLENMNGTIALNGEELIMYGVNIDEFIHKLNRSQHFSLMDVGAVLLAGPVGLLVTKGSDITKLLITNSKDSSTIIQLKNKWEINEGILVTSDVALSTQNNRIALKGGYGLFNDSLNVTIAVLDDGGCGAISQYVKGSIEHPELGELQVIKTLFKPVTNLVGDVLVNDCDPFYEGEVAHPKLN